MPTPLPSLRRSRLVVLSVATYLLGSVAIAAPIVQPTAAPEAPDEPEPFAVRADPLLPPEGALDQITDRVPATAGQAQANVFFLNYDGVTLKLGGQDNSATNTTIFQEFVANYQPYGQGAKRAASMQAVKSDWAPYNVVITDIRPQNGLYTMCVNSPTNVIQPGVLGVAPLDCFDQMAANIVLAFHSANDQFSAATQATTMSQEIAHAYGLEHVDMPNDIMNPSNAGADPSFLDQCYPLVGGNNCGQQHQQFCGGGGQNSHKELIWLFGELDPDTQPPSCTITAPANGSAHSPGVVNITAECTDDKDTSVDMVLFIDGAQVGGAQGGPQTSWPPNFTDPGMFCLQVEGTDDQGNKAQSQQVCITIEKVGETVSGGSTSTSTSGGSTSTTSASGTTSGGTTEEPTTGGPGGTSSGGDDTGNGDEGGGSASPLPPGFGDGGDEGCGCAQPTGSGGAGLLLLAAFGLVRRRRRG